MSAITIIGIDHACQPSDVGLALGIYSDGRTSIEEVNRASSREPPVEIVAQWISKSDPPVLLAIDAPLGWPKSLSETLLTHRAGDALEVDADSLFRRETDRFIEHRVGQKGLEVGADKIARTAHSALNLLHALRTRSNLDIPLAWDSNFSSVVAIEVYPAATLMSHGLPSSGYKGGKGPWKDVRRRIVEGVAKKVQLPSDARIIENADVLDAVVCVLAAQDFLSGHSFLPQDPAVARREGWIWVRKHEA